MKPYCFLLLMITFLTALSGCAREPSEEEIERIISLSIKEDMSSLIDKTYFGVNLGNVLGIDQLRINEIEKVSCDSIVNKKVTCQVLVDYEFINKKDGLSEFIGGVPRTRKIIEYQFVLLRQGWQVVDPLIQK
jgi:hypothetical protein